jgi:hypothetical protein
MHGALFAGQGRLEDPHVWPRAERLGLDVERCEADRRCGVKAGVATTATLFAAGERHTSPLDLAALERLIQPPS